LVRDRSLFTRVPNVPTDIRQPDTNFWTVSPPLGHPVLVRFHGGFLITGAALYPDFIPQWSLDYCRQHNAILVAPDYRLLPESNGVDILDDLDDFWKWLRDPESVCLYSFLYQ
jgi:acetyl esterase/lipase